MESIEETLPKPGVKLVNEGKNLAVEIQTVLSLLWQPGPQLGFGGQ